MGKRTYSWSLLIACLMFIGMLAPLSIAVSADSTLGGMDLDGYCRSLGYRGVTLTGHTVYDWYCVTNSGSHTGIEINKECNWQYHRNDAYAKYDNFNDSGSLKCYAPGSTTSNTTASTSFNDGTLLEGSSGNLYTVLKNTAFLIPDQDTLNALYANPNTVTVDDSVINQLNHGPTLVKNSSFQLDLSSQVDSGSAQLRNNIVIQGNDPNLVGDAANALEIYATALTALACIVPSAALVTAAVGTGGVGAEVALIGITANPACLELVVTIVEKKTDTNLNVFIPG